MTVSAGHKYDTALGLYSSTDRTIKSICEELGLSFIAFSSYLSKNHRDLILRRQGLEGVKDVKLRGVKGQTTEAYLKYKDAIAAAVSAEYIEFNMSQIARLFGVNPTNLSNQLRRHYPDVIPAREEERHRLGVNDNIHHGARPWCEKGYAEAVELLRSSDMTIGEAAEACGVSYKGLRTHILYYHKDLERLREKKRSEAASKENLRGERNGCWGLHEPSAESVEKYAEAVELYRSSSLGYDKIAQRFGLNKNSLRFHIKTWHKDLIVERRGFAKNTDYANTKRYKKSTYEKYAAAIAALRETGKSVCAIAREFGLNSEVFRSYLKEHEPELVKRTGRNRATARNRSETGRV